MASRSCTKAPPNSSANCRHRMPTAASADFWSGSPALTFCCWMTSPWPPLKDAERRDFLEICDDRYQRRCLILTSQMPVAHWHEQIGDPTIAESILDRLVHNAYRIELKGESMRKKRRKPSEEESQ